MSKYIKLEDAINLFGRSGEYHADTIADMLSDLPTIEVSEDAINREWILSQGKYYYNGKGEQEYAIPIGTIKSAPSVVPKKGTDDE